VFSFFGESQELAYTTRAVGVNVKGLTVMHMR